MKYKHKFNKEDISYDEWFKSLASKFKILRGLDIDSSNKYIRFYENGLTANEALHEASKGRGNSD